MRHAFHSILLISLFLISAPSFGASCPNDFFKEACTCNPPDNGYCISAGSKRFTYYKVAESLRKLVAPDAGFTLKTIEGGSVKNIMRMRWQNGVKFAIVQSDVLEFYKEEEENGNEIAGKIIKPLRVIMPLYNEEVHILARSNSGINTFSDLKNKRIALGKLGGGSAMTGKALYKYMFGSPLSKENSYYSPKDSDAAKDALQALAIDETVDAWIMVVGQGTKQFSEMAEGASSLIKLVKFDESNSTEQKILAGPYFTAKINEASYPWLKSDLPTITVKAFLITQKYEKQDTRRKIKNFTQAVCRNFPKLQAEGHPKWKEVELKKVDLPGGWQYSEDVLAGFKSSDCNITSEANPTTKNNSDSQVCSKKMEILNLCVPE